MSNIKSSGVFRLLTCEFSPEIQKEMRSAAELQTSIKIGEIRKRVAISLWTSLAVLLAWGLWAATADKPAYLLGGIAAALFLLIKLVWGMF